MEIIILVCQILSALAIIGLVLVQHGKGSDIGAAFGSGASNTMFGSAGSTSFLMRITIVLAVIFFAASLLLSYFAAHTKPAHPQGILNLPTTTATMPATKSLSLKPVSNTKTAHAKTFIVPHNVEKKTDSTKK